jgi:TolB-like protein/Tfp pilus assembly protein PilF
LGEPSPGVRTPERPSEERLDSWKEIAAYLGRDATTVQRWEKREAMPVHRHVHDKRGSVYALAGELDAWRQSRRLRPEEEQKDPAAQAPLITEGDHARRTTQQARRWLALAALALIALVVGAYTLSRGRAGRADNSKIKSLAVLPLKNLSGDATQEYLADGMTEALIGRLAGIRDLRVTSDTSVMRFKNPQISVPEIAHKLGVDAIVEGSVIREGNRIRVTAQLIRGATDQYLWSQTYDREMQDALMLESDVAQAIAEKVEVTVTGEERKRLAATRPVSPEVYESYLQGSYALNKSYKRADIDRAMARFQQAIQKDPTFAPAYVGLAIAYSELGSNFVGDPPDAARQKQIEAAQKAIALDPELAEPHVVLAHAEQIGWRWAEAEAEYRRALELNPNDADAHKQYAYWLVCQGRTEEALEWGRRARELDPLVVQATDIAILLEESRHYDEAIHELRTVLAAEPNDPVALWDLGIVLVQKGQPADALPVLEKAISVSNRSPGVTGILVGAYARAGRRSDALSLLAELQKRQEAGYVPASAFVNSYLGLGDYEQVFTWLERAYNEHSNVLQYLKVAPEFDPLRGDPRFVDLLRRVGLG